ncbi:uncharacterized protein LOC111084652, partial [Limulus polyphemus]|uniref:Uncharacterized protein LOC111084652 n=1 Tax=Limulus polyphemus TaxID=6850 RepID=A0ABM1S043_LIMPO
MKLLHLFISAIFLAMMFPADATLAFISSALAGIPGVLAAIPVAQILSVAGIVGLKLAIATKLLWFLGYYSSYSRGSHSVGFYADSDYEGGKNLGYPNIAVGGYPPLPPAPVQYGQEDQLYNSRRRRSTEPVALDSRAEAYFRYLSQLDSSSCVSRLACEATAKPRSFGYYGQTIARYL